jgi:hypothetical protein
MDNPNSLSVQTNTFLVIARNEAYKNPSLNALEVVEWILPYVVRTFVQ